MSALDDARSVLVGAAMEVTAGTWMDEATILALCKAAVAYANEREIDAMSRVKPKTPSGGAVFPPYGKTAGQPVAGASMRDLEFYRAGCVRTLADPEKARFHEKEKALLAAIDAEIAAR